MVYICLRTVKSVSLWEIALHDYSIEL